MTSPAAKADPLFDLESEYEVLGSIMYAPDQCEVAFERLEPGNFADAASGKVFACARELWHGGTHPMPALVRDRMGDLPDFAAWGGYDFLFKLWNDAAPGAIAAHVDAVVDKANRRAALAIVNRTARRLVDTASDFAETVEDLEQGVVNLSAGPQAGPALVSARCAADEVFTYLDADDLGGGILTGIAKFDEHVGAFQPGELVLIAGRTGMMKSGFGDNVALNVARAGVGFIQVNMEMGRKSMTWRHLCNLAQERFGDRAPEYRDVKRRLLTASQRGMLDAVRPDFSALPLEMVKHASLTLPGLRSLIRRQTLAWKRQGVTLGAVSVDHVGLLRSGLKLGRYEEQTAVAIGLKALAGEIGAPVFALVQLNREVEKRENRRPQIFDLKDTGAWEENADVAIGLYREAYYAMKEPEPSDTGGLDATMKWSDWQKRRHSRELEAIVMKFREGEEVTVKLWVDPGRDAVRSQEPDMWV